MTALDGRVVYPGCGPLLSDSHRSLEQVAFLGTGSEGWEDLLQRRGSGSRRQGTREDSYVSSWRRERISSCSWFWGFHRSLMLTQLPGTRATSFLCHFWLSLLKHGSLSPLPLHQVTENNLKVAGGCFSNTTGHKPYLEQVWKGKKMAFFSITSFLPQNWTLPPPNFENHGYRAYERELKGLIIKIPMNFLASTRPYLSLCFLSSNMKTT